MKEELIVALRKTADAIEAGDVRYSWTEMTHCNCGLVVKQLLGLDELELRESLSSEVIGFGVWSHIPGFFCYTSGVPVADLVRELMSKGFGKDEICYLETCSDPAVRERAGLPAYPPGIKPGREDPNAPGNEVFDYYRPQAVVKYMRAWAAMLEEEN